MFKLQLQQAQRSPCILIGTMSIPAALNPFIEIVICETAQRSSNFLVDHIVGKTNIDAVGVRHSERFQVVLDRVTT